MQKIFPEISHFFLKMKKIFQTYQKFLRIYHIYVRKFKKFSRHNIISSFQNWPLGDNNIFHARKEHFAPGKKARLKTWGPGPPVPTPLPAVPLLFLCSLVETVTYLTTLNVRSSETVTSKKSWVGQNLEAFTMPWWPSITVFNSHVLNLTQKL
jgi:hypothetical protein